MAAALNEVALAAVGGKIHVIGGSVLGVAGPYHQEYDIAKDTWRPRALLPKGLDHIGVAVLNGKIYTVGGFIASVHRDGQNAAYEYDPASDTWRILPLMKAGRGSVGVAALGGKIYAVGGRNAGRQRGRDPRGLRPRDQYLEGARAAAAARDHTATVAIDGKLHVIGGRTGGSTEKIDQHDIYDPATNTWTSGPPLPTARSGSRRDALQGHDPGARRRAAAEYVCAERSLQSEDQELAGARADAGGTPRHRRRRERRQCLCRGRFAAAGLGRRHQRADRIYLAVDVQRYASAPAA